MALIKCPTCGHDVSEQAVACPNCGQPTTTSFDQSVQTIQLTEKKWKILHISAFLLFIVGLFFISNKTFEFGLLFLFFGFVLSIIAKFGAWWSNG